MKNTHFREGALMLSIAVVGMTTLVSCTQNKKMSENPAKYITDADKLSMIYSMKDLDGQAVCMKSTTPRITNWMKW